MTTLESLKRRIDAVTELQTVVRTMKSLAAASIRQYDNALESLVDYNRTIEMGLQIALRDRFVSKKMHQIQINGDTGIIVIGSDHSLCGRFNEELIDFFSTYLQQNGQHFLKRRVLAIGSRIDSLLQTQGESIEECFFIPGSVLNITETVQQILVKVDDWRQQFDLQQLILFYNKRTSRTQHQPSVAQLIPVNLAQFKLQKQNSSHNQTSQQEHLNQSSNLWPDKSYALYTMDRDKLFSALINQYFFVTVFYALTQSLASEHSSRLASMQNAEKNIDERLSDLQINFRDLRQNTITQELLEVVCGFETLTGKNKVRN